ncbi:MAG: hypothetical protein JRN16_03655, partial [Nitrososphaerota archaeon]|nr:hypothetical protein [Nitrososphaerota archaeon]
GAFLGINPMGVLLQQMGPMLPVPIPGSVAATLTSKGFFPTAIAPAFMAALRLTFYIGAGLSLAAAVASALRGRKYVHGEEHIPPPARAPGEETGAVAAKP